MILTPLAIAALQIFAAIAVYEPAGQFERNGLKWLIMLVMASQKEFKNV